MHLWRKERKVGNEGQGKRRGRQAGMGTGMEEGRWKEIKGKKKEGRGKLSICALGVYESPKTLEEYQLLRFLPSLLFLASLSLPS